MTSPMTQMQKVDSSDFGCQQTVATKPEGYGKKEPLRCLKSWESCEALQNEKAGERWGRHYKKSIKEEPPPTEDVLVFRSFVLTVSLSND